MAQRAQVFLITIQLTFLEEVAPMKAIVRHYVLLPAVLGLVLGAMGRAEADSITYTSPITSTLEVPHFVPQFDPALGTLTEVDFSATGSGSARIDYSPPQTITNGIFAHVEDFLYSLIGNNVSLGLFVSSSTFSTPGGEPLMSGVILTSRLP
jgi:hypothetical protein